MKNIPMRFVSTCVILTPLVSAFMIPHPGRIISKLPINKPQVQTRQASSALNFHNPYMDHLDSSQSYYRSRESHISLGNRFRTVPKPYYDSNFQHKPARPLTSPPLARSSAASATAAASSPQYSEYGTQNVYWNDVNGFPQDVINQQAVPSMDDMRNAAMGNNGPINGDRIYSPDKYYQNNPNPTSSNRFQDIPFQSNENYAKKFHRNSEWERQGPGAPGGYGMNGDFGNRPMDQPYSPDMMRPGGDMNMGGHGYGYDMPPSRGMGENDFPSLMSEIMPPAGGMMADPYSRGQGYGGYDQYSGMGMGGGMMGGMGMNMPRGDWGFQEMGMGPRGDQWGHQEWGYGAPPGGDFFGGQQQWGMLFGGQPFGGPGVGGPGGFW